MAWSLNILKIKILKVYKPLSGIKWCGIKQEAKHLMASDFHDSFCNGSMSLNYTFNVFFCLPTFMHDRTKGLQRDNAREGAVRECHRRCSSSTSYAPNMKKYVEGELIESFLWFHLHFLSFAFYSRRFRFFALYFLTTSNASHIKHI